MRDDDRRNSPFFNPCRENGLWLAQSLNEAARDLGRAIDTVEAMAARGWVEIAHEEQAADTIVIDGPRLAVALRTLAMRLDRALMLNEQIVE